MRPTSRAACSSPLAKPTHQHAPCAPWPSFNHCHASLTHVSTPFIGCGQRASSLAPTHAIHGGEEGSSFLPDALCKYYLSVPRHPIKLPKCPLSLSYTPSTHHFTPPC
jgi:hypothetical protein